ncbi:RNA helicase, partial [Streptomonospora algeriensis]
MPKLAISPTFLSDFSRLDHGIQAAALTAVQEYMSGDDARIETVAEAADSRVRLLRIGQEWTGVVAPGAQDSAWLIAVRPHEEAVAVARELPAAERFPADAPAPETP